MRHSSAFRPHKIGHPDNGLLFKGFGGEGVTKSWNRDGMVQINPDDPASNYTAAQMAEYSNNLNRASLYNNPKRGRIRSNSRSRTKGAVGGMIGSFFRQRGREKYGPYDPTWVKAAPGYSKSVVQGTGIV